jgi:hypothetical protein
MIIIKNVEFLMDYYNAFPFSFGLNPNARFMGYGQEGWKMAVPQDRVLEDLEYLRQMYPEYSRRYQGVVQRITSRMDYDGSFIYDQYPDRITFMRMVDSVMKVIKDEGKDDEGWEEKEPWIRELITLLIYNEILLLRRKKRNIY